MCSLEILIHGSSITRKDTTNPMHESCMEPDVDLLPNVPYIYIHFIYIYIYTHFFRLSNFCDHEIVKNNKNEHLWSSNSQKDVVFLQEV